MSSIDVNALRKASEAIFNYLDERDIESIDIDKDYYWALDSDQLYDVYGVLKGDKVGQLSENQDFMVETLEDISTEEITYIVPQFFHWYASLMRYLGDYLNENPRY